MNSIFKRTLGGLLLVPLLALGVATTVAIPAYAGQPDQNCDDGKVNISEGVDCAKGKQTRAELFAGDNSLFKTVTNVLLFLIGAVSVIMLVIGGLRYTLSNGDSTQVTNAKNTILYSIVGIVVALLAYAIVNFVVTSFISGNGS